MGDPVDLGHTVGVLTSDSGQQQSLIWTYNGVEFTLSRSVGSDEMIQIAKSTSPKK